MQPGAKGFGYPLAADISDKGSQPPGAQEGVSRLIQMMTVYADVAEYLVQASR